jgi:hypothetical protein
MASGWKDGFRMCLSLMHILQPSFQLRVCLVFHSTKIWGLHSCGHYNCCHLPTQKTTFLIFQEVSPRKLFFLFLSPVYCSLLDCNIIRRMKCINRKYLSILYPKLYTSVIRVISRHFRGWFSPNTSDLFPSTKYLTMFQHTEESAELLCVMYWILLFWKAGEWTF